MSNSSRSLYALIPSVDKLLSHELILPQLVQYGHAFVTATIRSCLLELRSDIQQGLCTEIDITKIATKICTSIKTKKEAKLKTLFNLSGTVLHTNLGRAVLPLEAIEQVIQAMRYPVNLEFDLQSGGRGDRDDLIESLLCELTGAEAATVVNNNAAAVFLVLNALGQRKETIVSRGELVEIGGAFRVPDIMKRAGTRLTEVGTTNRTHLRDYEEAISTKTGMLMKVHCSNYAITGFTHEVSLQELAPLAKQHHLPLVIDLGSGTLIDPTQWNLPAEMTVAEAISAGADIVTFSGDKLLGGPQAGLIVGRKDLIQKIKKNPLKRVLRVSKLTLAALEPVLEMYRHPETLSTKLDTLRLLTRPVSDIKAQVDRLLLGLTTALGTQYQVAPRAMMSQIGSGAMPIDSLASMGVVIERLPKQGPSLSKLEQALRRLPRPVIGRMQDQCLWLDFRCLREADEAEFIEQLQHLLL